MTARREDLDTVLSAPVVVGRIPGDRAGPVLRGAASWAPWEIAGSKCRVGGLQSRSGLDVRFEGGGAARVAYDSGDAERYVVYPGLAEREGAGPRGPVTERVVCYPDLPVTVVQWVGSAPDTASVAWAGAQAITGQTGAVFEVDGKIVGSLHTDGAVALRVGEDGTVEVDFDSSADVRSLVLSAGSDGAIPKAVQAAKHAPAHATRAARGPAEDGLVIRSGSSDLDDGWAWLLSRVGGAIDSGSDPDDRLTLALACLSAGLPKAPAARMDGYDDAPIHAAYLAARLSMTTGSDHHAQSAAERLLAGELEADGSLAADAYASLADALRYGATEEEQETLRTRARSARAASPKGSGVRRLPTIGGAQAVGPSWWQAVLDGIQTETGADPESTRALPGLFLDDPDQAWRKWSEAVARGVSRASLGPGMWSVDRASEAELVVAFTHGLLGYASDAPSGRYVLKPRIPTAWNHFELHRVPTGKGAFGLTYEKRKDGHHFLVRPERGSVPVILVFEPSVPGRVGAVTVDGAPSPITSDFSDGRSVVQLQLPLDGERSVQLEPAESP